MLRALRNWTFLLTFVLGYFMNLNLRLQFLYCFLATGMKIELRSY